MVRVKVVCEECGHLNVVEVGAHQPRPRDESLPVSELVEDAPMRERYEADMPTSEMIDEDG